jgi:four helix bundle protein
MKDDLKAAELRSRIKRFALRIIRLYAALGRSGAAQVIGRQLLRSETSVGAQHREAYRARSAAEFVSKLDCATQELDETIYWLELLIEAGIVKKKLLDPLINEANELTAIFVASSKTVKKGTK